MPGADVPHTPSLAQFQDTCRREFAFLRDLGYSELHDSDPADRFEVRFSNGTLTLSIRGENWGQHAGVSLVHADGREAPVWWFIPVAERANRPAFDPTGFSQLDDIRITALTMARYCRDVLAGDTAKFDAVANEWRRVRDARYRESLQKRKLP
jgi:hypothetical protein